MSSIDKFSVNGKDFNIQTPNMSMSDLDTSLIDFVIEDDSENAIVSFQKGHIKTKNFNSETVLSNIDSIENEIEFKNHYINFWSLADTSLPDNPLNSFYYPNLASIFDNWGFIGDSLTSGESASINSNGTTIFYDDYKYSWGQYLCRICDTSGYNFSNGGQTAKGWVNSTWDTGYKGFLSNIKENYIIALETNDNSKINDSTYYPDGLGNASTDICFSDKSKNAKSFIGYYSFIIQSIKEIQPRARIFLFLDHRWSNMNTPLRELPKYFTKTYLLDFETYDKDYITNNGFLFNGHWSREGYLTIANKIVQFLNYIVRKNYSDFIDIGLYNDYYKSKPVQFTGTLNDSSGNIMASTQIALLNSSNQLDYYLKTDSSGAFSIVLPSKNYTLSLNNYSLSIDNFSTLDSTTDVNIIAIKNS